MPNSQCPHSTIIKNLCCSCGVYVNTKIEKLKADGRVALLHNVPDLLVTKDLANRFGINDREHLLNSKKLILVVDLDHTILHSATIQVSNMKLIDKREHQSRVDKILNDYKGPYISHVHTNYFQYTFFRENMEEFFQQLDPYFEFHIFTMGTRDYVKPIIDYIDPTGKLFASRIKTRNECEMENNKYIELKSIFPCSNDLVCILDDRLDVWMYSYNVLQIYPYKNPCVVALDKEFNTKSPDELLKTYSIDESTVLPKLVTVLKKIHHQYYYESLNTSPPTSTICTFDIVRKFRNSTFNCTMTFYIDNDLLKKIKDERQGDLSYKIKLMGGNTVKSISDPQCKDVTHVLVDSGFYLPPQLNNVLKSIIGSRSISNINVIDSDWIHLCYYHWEHVDESPFTISPKLVDNNDPDPIFYGKRDSLYLNDNKHQEDLVERHRDKCTDALNLINDEDHQLKCIDGLNIDKNTTPNDAIQDIIEGRSTTNRESTLIDTNTYNKLAQYDQHDIDQMADELEDFLE